MPWKCQSVVPDSQRSSPTKAFFLILMFVSITESYKVKEMSFKLIRFEEIREEQPPTCSMEDYCCMFCEETVSYPLNLRQAQLCLLTSKWLLWYFQRACCNHSSRAFMVFAGAPAALREYNFRLDHPQPFCKEKWHCTYVVFAAPPCIRLCMNADLQMVRGRRSLTVKDSPQGNAPCIPQTAL